MSRCGTFRSIAARCFDSKPIRYSFPCSRLPFLSARVCILDPSELPCQLSTSRPPLYTSTYLYPFPRFSAVVSTIPDACLYIRREWMKGASRENMRTKGKSGRGLEKIEKNFHSIESILFLSNLDVYCIRLMILLYTGDIAKSPSCWPNSTCHSFSHLFSFDSILSLSLSRDSTATSRR